MEEKIKAIKKFPQLEITKQLRRFPVLVNFCWKLVPNCSLLLQSLNMLWKEGNCRRKLESDETAATSFVTVKDTLSEKMLLSDLVDGAPITLVVNASNKESGAVVQQQVDGEQ